MKEIQALRRWKKSVLPTMFLIALLVAPASASAANPEPLWRAPENAESGSAAGQLDHPNGVTADPISGHVFVAEESNYRVDVFDSYGQFSEAWGWGVADGSPELQTCGPKANPPTQTCQQGIQGSGAGQIGSANGGLAVDSDGNIWVADFANHRLQKFNPNGEFLLMVGGGVDKGPLHPGNVCTGAYISEGDSCGAGTAGTGPGEFNPESSGGLLVSGPSGALYVADRGRIEELAVDGTFKSEIVLGASLNTENIAALARASDGDFYLTLPKHNNENPGESPIYKINSAGEAVESITFPIEPSGHPGVPTYLAVDSHGDLYVTLEYEGFSRREVVEYGPAGEELIPPGEGFAKGLGAAPNGGEASAGIATNLVGQNGETDIFVAGTAAQGKSSLAAYGPAPEKWPPPQKAPAILSQFSESVGTADATVRAAINPHFWADTSFYVEYGTGTCSLGGCPQTQPVAPGSLLGAGRVDRSATTKPIVLSNLMPGTTYHYRFVAQSSGGGPTVGVGALEEDETFITPPLPSGGNADCPNQSLRLGASAKLADCRAYEMVTPVEKNNTDIVSLINLNGLPATLDQSAVSGEKLAYTTSQGFGDSVGTPYVSQYIASRGTSGWSSHSITPTQGVSPREPGNRVDIEFRAFTPDLCTGMLLHTTDPPLAPGAEEHIYNLYRRQNCGEEGYESLLAGEPTTFGISTDGRCVVYGGVGLSGTGTIFDSCEGRRQQVNLLPSGKVMAGTVGTYVGGIPPRISGTRSRAVSENGSRIYWTGADGSLYLRINAGEKPSKVEGGECVEHERACTLPVSKTVSNDPAHFLTASSDGTKAVFALEAPGAGNSSLYEYDAETGTSTLIAPQALPADGLTMPALGTSADPDHVFLVSSAVLTGANVEGKEPIAGKPNIYFYDAQREGADRYRFVGTLTGSDVYSQNEHNGPVSPVSSRGYLSAVRVSPDGLHLAFMSSASLTGYNNTDARSGKRDLEIYSYDATADGGVGRLLCVSCNPTRQVPEGRNIEVEIGVPSGSWGAALLPFPATELYGSRVVSDDGSRIFFDSFEALLPRDTNGKADVYEWEAAGAGDCRETDSDYSAENGGCLNLISTGESASDSAFVDASPDGRDVFFTTASSLAPQDVGLIDIYDAREDGGYPPPASPRAACEGEACQGPFTPPNDPTPASAAFKGAGNVRPEPTASRCGKGKAKSKGRCVAKKGKRSRHKAKAHKRANNNRRNAR